MPSQSTDIPRTADGIAAILYARIANGTIDRLHTIHTRWQAGKPLTVERHRLFPLDITAFAE